jgi:hypothetical protein
MLKCVDLRKTDSNGSGYFSNVEYFEYSDKPWDSKKFLKNSTAFTQLLLTTYM